MYTRTTAYNVPRKDVGYENQLTWPNSPAISADTGTKCLRGVFLSF